MHHQNKRAEPEPSPMNLARDSDALYTAGQARLGTDEKTFIGILTRMGPRCGCMVRVRVPHVLDMFLWVRC